MTCNKCKNTRRSLSNSVKDFIKEPSKEKAETVVKKAIVGVKRILSKRKTLRK